MAISIFARIGTIQGESQDETHHDEIEVLAWSWGLSQSGTVGHGGGGEAKANLQDFSFTHYLDKASPALMTACATGQHLKDATITVRKAGRRDGHEYLVIALADVLVTSVSASGSEGDTTMESVTLAFAKVDLAYTPQEPDGSLGVGIHFEYDAANKEI